MTFPFDIAVVFLPLLGAAIAGLFGRKIGDEASEAVTCGCLLASTLISMALFRDIALGGHPTERILFDWISSGDLSINWGVKVDTLTAIMFLVVTGVSSMVHLYSISYMEHDKSRPRFMAYLSLFTFFMLMLVSAPNLVQMFFGWEGVGLMSYLLINFWYERPAANNASMKAFLVNRVGDFGFILGIFGCFALFNSVAFEPLFVKASGVALTRITFLGVSFPALTTVCLLLFVGAMGKSAQLGLHTWLPDAMEGPTPVSALIHAATMVTAGVFMVARLSPLFEFAPGALTFVAIAGGLTCIFAALIGLTQFDIKRVIAYSTMSQLGYMFFAAGVSAYSAAIFHLMTHAFFKALLFLCAGSVIHALSGEQDMRRMGGLWRKTPVTYGLMWIGALALAGIGIDGVFGFAGFYSKDLILESALGSGRLIGTLTYAIGITAAFMTAFYSWRLLLLTFHGEPRSDDIEHAHESSWAMIAPLVPLALGAILTGWWAYAWFGGESREAFWNAAIYVLPTHDSIGASHHVSDIFKWLPVIVALAGIGFAYLFYVLMPELPAIVSTAFGWIYRTVFHKFYVDELYDAVFVRGTRRLAKVMWRSVDDGTIDRFGPNGIADLSMLIARRVGQLESGYLYHYAFAMVLGVAAFVSWFWLRG